MSSQTSADRGTDGFSSHGGSGAGSSLIQVTAAGRDEMESSASSAFWNGCFGTFYTVNKDRKTSAVFLGFRLLMEFMQLFVLLLNAQYGWQFDTDTRAWQFIEFIQVRPFMTRIGHDLFVGLFLTCIVLLFVCLGIYAWVFHCFQINRFDYQWPLRLARLYGAGAFECLDIMVISLMLTGLDCRYYHWPAATKLHNNEFPTYTCLKAPGLVYAVLGLVGAILFIALAGFNKLAQMDLNPTTLRLDAYAHPSAELWGFAIKMLMVLGSIFLGDYRHLAVLFFVCMCCLTFFFWKWEPHVYSWVNYIRLGTYTSVLYVSCLFMALQYPPDSIAAAHKLHATAAAYHAYVRTLEIALVGVLPAFCLGALASYYRLRYYHVTVVNLFKNAPSTSKPRNIYRFTSAREVEIVTRSCRVWADLETPHPEAVALAEIIIKGGLACQSTSAWMALWYTSFLVDVQGSYQSGFTQLQMVHKMDPGFIDQYAIFSREQDHAQKTKSGANGQSVDALSDVEFGKSYRLVMFAHKEALEAIRSFWQLLQHAVVNFEDLTYATRQIDHFVKRAERTYRSVLQRHGDKPRLLRLYAKFLREIKHDPWGSIRWIEEAEKLELTQGESRHTNIMGLDDDAGTLGTGRLSLFSVTDDGRERAMCMFNSHGTMTITNEAMRDMFGYGKAELKGKSVSTLLPPPFSEQIVQLIRNFALHGRGSVVMRTSEALAVSKDRGMFAASITVVRVSGVGEDSTFLASIEATPLQEDTATLWLLPSGQIMSVDSQFSDWFGDRPVDLEGGSLAAWSLNSKKLDAALKLARHNFKAAASQASALPAETSTPDDMRTDMTVTVHSSGLSTMASAGADFIAAALAGAAAPSVAGSAPSLCSQWLVKGVRVRHKFADPVNVDITITNTRLSAFCLHTLTARRTGDSATKLMPHMLVTSPQGPLLHVTEAFSALLGTTPQALIANGSSTALEALMVQPFGLMHRVGLASSIPSHQPPSYSCRSGLSVLMPVAGQPGAEALPVKMQMKKRVNLDEVNHVCILAPTTWEQALDERSLRLTVDEAGTILSTGSSPMQLFGFNASVLVGYNISCCVDALRALAGQDSVETVLAELVARAETAPNSYWRVGVCLTNSTQGGDDEATALLTAHDSPVCFRATKLVAAVMTVVTEPAAELLFPVRDPAGEEEEQAVVVPRTPPPKKSGYELRLWRADLVTSIVEVDSNGLVVETETYLEKLYPAGAALGVSASTMLGQHIRDYLPLGDRKFMDLYDDTAFPAVPARGAPAVDPGRKKSNIKTVTKTADMGRVGTQALLYGRHRLDGGEVRLSVQIVRKGATGAYLVIHLVQPQTSRLDMNADRDFLYDVEMEAPHKRGTLVPVTSQSEKTLKAALLNASINAPLHLLRDSAPTKSFSMRVEGDAVAVPLSPRIVAAEPGLSRMGSDVAMIRSVSNMAGNVGNWVLTQGGPPPQVAAPVRSAAGIDGGDEERSQGDSGSDVEGSEERLLDSPVLHSTMGPSDSFGGGLDERSIDARSRSTRYGGGSDAGASRLDEAANDDGDGADFRRGQRFKKLSKIMSHPVVAPATRNFKWLAIGMAMVCAIATIAVYAIITVLMKDQIQSVNDLYNMGRVPGKLMRIAGTVMDLAMLYAPPSANYLSSTTWGMSNTGADLKYRLKLLASSVATLSSIHDHVYIGFLKPRQLPTTYGLRALYEVPSLPEVHQVMIAPTESGTNPVTFLIPNTTFSQYSVVTIATKTTLLAGLNKICSMTLDIWARAQWYNDTFVTTFAKSTSWADWVDNLYIRKNAATTYLNACFTVLDDYSRIVISSAKRLNDIQVIILVAVGCLLPALAVFVVSVLGTRKVDMRRHTCFAVFLVVPSSMVRTLATQSINLGADDMSDDEMDDANPLRGATGAVVAPPAGHGEAADAGGKAARGAPSGGGKGVHINIAGETLAGTASQPALPLRTRIVNALAFWRTKKVAAPERRTLLRSWRGTVSSGIACSMQQAGCE